MRNPFFIYSAKMMRTQQLGMNLIEIMVAMMLSLFLVLGLLTIFQSTKLTAKTQYGMAEIQEQQRNAITILSNVIQAAGYFPINSSQPLTLSDANGLKKGVLPEINKTYAAGAGIAGSNNMLRIRFQAPPNDTGNMVLNCQGDSNQTSQKVYYDNLFYLKNNSIMCALGTNTKAVKDKNEKSLVEGVKDMSVIYGIDTKGGGSVTRYLNASQVTDWKQVRSVKLTLTFINPLKGQDGQPDTLQTTQIIQLMGNL